MAAGTRAPARCSGHSRAMSHAYTEPATIAPARRMVVAERGKLRPSPTMGRTSVSASGPARSRAASMLAITASTARAGTARTGASARVAPSRSPSATSVPSTGIADRARRRAGSPMAAAGRTPMLRARATAGSNGATAIEGTAYRRPRPNRDHRQVSPPRAAITVSLSGSGCGRACTPRSRSPLGSSVPSA
ncbi:hypothetical protein AUV07_11625 [Microbacterium sp. CH1]|nr:hypothetical protein AUV07_11625 [Microbacterium sp. CH1]